ncbi:hypothetical protein AMK16_30130 [Streptomyces sp. CB00455]|nr:hypothetical protein AMK16_30130 [Streptomyces sp. CB00455]
MAYTALRHAGGTSLSSTSRGSSGLTPTFRRANVGRPRTPARTRMPALAASSAFDSPSKARNGRTVAYRFASAAGMATSALRFRRPLQQRRLRPQRVPGQRRHPVRGICDSLSRPSRCAPISSTRSSARANAVPVVRVGGRRSRSSSENREPSGVFSVATRSPGSAGSARRAAPATVACSRFVVQRLTPLRVPLDHRGVLDAELHGQVLDHRPRHSERAVHFRRSALPPYPTLLHNLHRYRLTAEAWHPWMLRIPDIPEAVRLRGWLPGSRRRSLGGGFSDR